MALTPSHHLLTKNLDHSAPILITSSKSTINTLFHFNPDNLKFVDPFLYPKITPQSIERTLDGITMIHLPHTSPKSSYPPTHSRPFQQRRSSITPPRNTRNTLNQYRTHVTKIRSHWTVQGRWATDSKCCLDMQNQSNLSLLRQNHFFSWRG